VHIVGILTNCSSTPWKEALFECRFFDSEGKLIDVAHPRDYFTVLPNSDLAFSLKIRPARATNQYSSYKVTVTTALNGYSRF
jgi:hypothetical protein